MRLLRTVALGLVLALIGLIAVATVVMHVAPTFGARVTDERRVRAEQSPQFRNGRFENAVPPAKRTTAMMWDYAKQQYGGTQQRHPPKPIPVVPVSTTGFDKPPPPGLRAIWFGHASVYLEIDGLRVFVDPVLSDYASPIAGIGPKRFHASPLALAALPPIDAVLISHDHYDHLDMTTVTHLASKGARFVVPLGIGAHLERWGIASERIVERDWWGFVEFGNVRITSTPVRHYSGRALRDGNATLWSSWVIRGPRYRAYFSGDTGAGEHFREIGERLGPFDLSLIKIGAYGPGQPWIDVHMTPEDAVAAHVALRARRLLPVHWGTFNLGFHAWDEPVERAVVAAKAAGVEIVTPRVGDVVTAGQPFASRTWWKE